MKLSKAVTALRRRLRFLQERITHSTEDLSFDKQEAGALRKVLEYVEEQRKMAGLTDEQKDVLYYDENVRRIHKEGKR